MELSVIISNRTLDPAIDEKIRCVLPLLLRRPKLHPANSDQVTACRCGTVFGVLTRKHHCRSCGEVFCYVCTEKRAIVPPLLVEYTQRTGWWKEGELARVCNECHERIIRYETCRPLLEQFYNHPPTLEKLYSLARDNETTLWAVSYYLSEMRRIQYLFPSEELTLNQITFLQANKEHLVGHSYWLLQLLKIESIEPRPLTGPHNLNTLCTRNCQPSLNLSHAVCMLLFPKVYGGSVEVALKMIRESPGSELEPYIGILALTFNARLYEILIEKAIVNRRLAQLFYWSLNILSSGKNGEAAIAYRETLLMNLTDKKMVNFRRVIPALEMGLHATRTVVSEFDVPDPLAPDLSIGSIEEVRTGTSYSRPFFIKYTSDRPRQIMYKREDIRKDACIVRIIRMISSALTSIQDPFPLISYTVIPISPKSGLVEIVEDCQTLTEVVKAGTVSNYLQKHNPDRLISEVQSVYTTSLAFWTIITYLFGVGDRHFDNIMLSKNGILFHIDYGFIFGSDPKPYSPKIRLNSYMLEGIGGDEKYESFKELCYKIFMLIRQKTDCIYTLLLELAMADPPILGSHVTEPFLRQHLATVFFMGASDDEARSQLEFIIDTSRDSLGGNLNEYVHGAVKTASQLIGRVTGYST